jgi:Uma2 family endonuclease
MAYMDTVQELIEVPLNAQDLAVRYRDLCENPLYSNLPGKIELDLWGRMVMSPASTYHGQVQAALCQRLAVLGGVALIEVGIVTAAGLFAPDLAWASAEFMIRHGNETPLTSAPELCIEVVSPSNSTKELREKTDAYLAAGAHEVWIVYPQSKRLVFHRHDGEAQTSRFVVDVAGIFGDT